MLDLLMIQEEETGLTYFEYKGKHTQVKKEHSSIFSGFLSAIRQVTQEMFMGRLTQISTEFHHCIILKGNTNVVILIFDSEDKVRFWRDFGKNVLSDFEKEYPNSKKSINNSSLFKKFNNIFKKRLKNYTEEGIPKNSCLD